MKLWAIKQGIRLLSEKRDKSFFDYKSISDEMWQKKVRETQEKTYISFNLENDYDIAQREIEIDQDEWDHFPKVKFRCELYSAGGDWEDSVLYFRCQLFKGYARDMNQGDCFIYIPCKTEGNSNLVQDEHWEWRASTDEDHNSKKEDRRPNEHKAWQGLKKYLTKLVEDEIAAVRKERRDKGY